MLELFKIAGLIDLNGADKVDKDLSKIDKKSESTASKFGNFAKKFGKSAAIAGGAVAGIGTAAFAMAEKVTSSFDGISKGAQRLGVSTDFYQEMDFWASQNGLSHANMEKAVGRFNQRLGMAQNGNEKYSTALKQMGVDMEAVRNGTLSTEDAYAQSIQSLSQMTNAQDQVNLATELFGTKLAREMLPALQEGALSIEDAKLKAQELGLVIGEESLAAGVKFQDTWDQLKRTMEAVGLQIGGQLVPIFQTLMEWVLANMPLFQSIFSTVFGVIKDIFGVVISVIQEFINWLQTLLDRNKEILTGLWDAFKQYLGFIIDYWTEVFQGIKSVIEEVLNYIYPFVQDIMKKLYEFWKENGEQILESAKTIFNTVKDTVKTVFEAVWSIVKQILDKLVPFIKKQLDAILKFWDENGEQIMKAVDNAFKFIKGVIEFVMPAIKNIIDGAWKVISSIFETAIGIIMGLIKTFSGLLTGDFEGIKEGLTQIWESLWEGIKGVVEGAWELLSGAFEGLWESVSGWFTGLGEDAVEWGSDLIEGFWEGIKGMGSWLSRKVSKFVSDNIPAPIRKILGIASPSKLMMEYGKDTVEGQAIGMEKKESRLKKVAQKMAEVSSKPILNNTNKIIGNDSIVRIGKQQEPTQAPLRSGGITQNIAIHSPKHLSPSETARKNKQAARQMALEWGV